MENAGSWGNIVAQGLIVLFLLFLLALFIRTSMMFGSVVLLALTRDRKKKDSATNEVANSATDHPDSRP
ncbi:MAG TPA: hypothetical protein VGE27_01345 [Gemmatimonas sp.]|uniref:hypothetical protein n=1 Tax=Gemmatimonas sp. TaxID=1962908 RepID=UPI002EDA2C9F